MQTIAEILAQELEVSPIHVQNVIDLLDGGNTIPFIARYRKELHGSMDDTLLRKLEDRLTYLRNLEQRRQEVKSAIEGQEKLTPELAAAIDSARTLAEVEDLYRPYKQKRRTRATVAREKGLAPLAELLLAQRRDCPDPAQAAQEFIDPEKGVETAADALQGANDIVAELLSDDAVIRKTLRELLRRQGRLRSLATGEEDSVYRLYYDFEQPLPKLAGHQILAINRGEKEGFLSVTVLLDRESHRSAYNALALLDLKPVYLERPWLASEGITGPISPSSVAQALEEHPEAKTLCITSPTYYGVLSDLPALAELMHRRGGVLVVDGAHGAHLPFLGNDHLSAADLVVTSAHKTLPALGQSALLLCRLSLIRCSSCCISFG